jgi:GntR family transcriptional regulator
MGSALTKLGDAPLYRLVKQRILESLSVGEWVSSQTLPSQAELCSRYKVSVGTLRKAVDELVQERILLRKAGLGTFIAPHDEERLLFHFFNIVGRDGTRKLPVSELQSFARVSAPAEVARQLGLARSAAVYRIENLRKIDGEPALYDTLYTACERFPGLTREKFAGREETIYNFYLASYGINIIRTVETIGTALCPDTIAKSLQIKAKAPVLEITRVALTYNDEPVEYRLSYMSSEKRVYLNDQGKSRR